VPEAQQNRIKKVLMNLERCSEAGPTCWVAHSDQATRVPCLDRPGHGPAARPAGGGGGGGGGSVEWYQAGGTRFAAADYNYPAADGAASSSAAYGSFEDEAPLLEGAALRTKSLCGGLPC